jgi:hypothetical protein
MCPLRHAASNRGSRAKLLATQNGRDYIRPNHPMHRRLEQGFSIAKLGELLGVALPRKWPMADARPTTEQNWTELRHYMHLTLPNAK